MIKKETYFCDLDGTLIKYTPFDKLLNNYFPEIIKTNIDFINQKHKLGHKIILTTARPEEYRNFTLLQINNIGLKHDQLVMGIGRGLRYLINDLDPAKPNEKRAISINVIRDKENEIGKL